MSNRANKQRMKRRLIAAIAHHDKDLGMELMCLGDEHPMMQWTHKALKYKLRGVSVFRSLHRSGAMLVAADGVGGYIMVAVQPLPVWPANKNPGPTTPGATTGPP